MIDSIINCKNFKEADCVILTAGYDRSSSLGKGAHNGAMEIVKCLHEDIEFFDKYTKLEPGYLFKIAHKKINLSNNIYPEDMVNIVKKTYSKFVNSDAFLILLGGDHSVSTGAFQAIAEKDNPRDVTILQIDAHCDLRNDDGNANPDQSHVSMYAHSCVMRRAFELGYNLVQVGVRSYAKEEYDFFRKNKIRVFEWSSKTPSVGDIIKSIKTKKVYITLDVDGIDPAHIPGTGTPVPGGLEWYYTIDLLLSLIKKKEIIGCDIVELAPISGSSLSQFAAAQLCYYIIGGVLNKK